MGLEVGRDRQANEHGEDADVVDEEPSQQPAAPPRHLGEMQGRCMGDMEEI